MFCTDEVTQCFQTLAAIDVPDGLSIQVCWECLAYVKQVKRFQKQILKSYDILMDYSSKQTFPKSPQDLSLKAEQRLKTTELTIVSISNGSAKEIPILPELKKESIIKEELMDVKIEIDDDYMQFDLKPIEPESKRNNPEPFQDYVASSDEDIQLSMLKKNKRENMKKKQNSEKEFRVTTYKTCAVPQCKSTTIKTPEKLFIHVPTAPHIRKEWCYLAGRKHSARSYHSMYFCEDHFDLVNDMENYRQWKIMGQIGKIRLRPNCLPTKFDCQLERKSAVTYATTTTSMSPSSLKRQQTAIIPEVEYTAVPRSSTSSNKQSQIILKT